MKKCLKAILAFVLCVTLVVCSIPAFDANNEKFYMELADADALYEMYLNPNEQTVSEYPNGAMIIPVTAADLEMKNLYAVDILRQGGTADEVSITLKTIDLSAAYGTDYEIFETNRVVESPVKGEANPYYAIREHSFIPLITENETVYETENNSENTPQIREEVSELNDAYNELMPTSSELVLHFAEGENAKRVFVQTYMNEVVTDDLQFMLTLSEPKGCSIGTNVASVFTIKEHREKPEAYIQITDEIINPKSEMAYVKVQRTGNLGGYTSFNVSTLSDTAKAGKNYDAVDINLSFSPGMTEIKVPVRVLDAADGTAFSVNLEDVQNATVTKSSATVEFAESAKVQQEIALLGADSELVSTSAMTYRESGNRGQEFVNLKNFTKSKSIGSNGSVSTDASGLVMTYKNGASCKDHAISAVSKEKINFTGVDSITTQFNMYTGSCSWDYCAVYVGDSDKLSDGKANCSWMGEELDGFGLSWNMTEVGKDPNSRSFSLDSSVTNGNHNLYFVLQKGGFWGECGLRYYDNSTGHTVLNLTKYTVEMLAPDEVQVYKNGVLTSQKITSSNKFVDPGTMSDDDSHTKESVEMYRNETAAIVCELVDAYKDVATFKGIKFCNPSNKKECSELISLNSQQLTLSIDLLEKYSKFFDEKNKVCVIPVFELDEVEFDAVGGVDRVSGANFVVDESASKATATLDGKTIMEITWTPSTRSGGKYLVGDEIVFTYKEYDADKVWFPTYTYRGAETKDLLKVADATVYHTTVANKTIKLGDEAVSIAFGMEVASSTTLTVTNPDMGDYSGKGDGFENYEGSAAIVSGYRLASGDVLRFEDKEVSNLITFAATPKAGYRAKWQYTNTATKETETYYGNAFFYTVQSALNAGDNNVTLTFEKVDSSARKSVIVTGNTFIQHGTIVSPPKGDTEVYDVAPNALVNIGAGSALSNGSGEFVLLEDPNAETPENLLLEISRDEIHQAAVYFNDQYYIATIDMSEYYDTAETSVEVKLNLPYKTYGIKPESIVATDLKGTTYTGDTITMVVGETVNFTMDFSRQGENKEYPVNMVRWSIESDNHLKYYFDIEVPENSNVAKWGSAISELISPGEKLYVEFFNKYYDSDADEQYWSFGKFDTGYKFITTETDETITYMPDIGVDSEASVNYRLATTEDGEVVDESEGTVETVAHPIPCIGPISPTISIKGFSPIINISTQKNEETGNYDCSLNIGLQMGTFANMLDEDPAFKAAGNAKAKAKAAIDNLCDYADYFMDDNSPIAGKGNLLNLKTSINVSFSLTFCFQLKFYIDGETAEWCFTSGIFVAGAAASLRVSVPFVLLYVPCFVFLEANINPQLCIGMFPAAPEGSDNTSVYLTLDELDEAGKSWFQGLSSWKMKISIGAGVGYDALVSVQCKLINDFLLEFNDYSKGFGLYSLQGGVAIEFLFFRADWTGTLVDCELFNSTGKPIPEGATAAEVSQHLSENLSSDIAAAMTERLNSEDIMNTCSLGDMVINIAENSDALNSDIIGSAQMKNEKSVKSTNTIIDPEIIEISEGVYFISSVVSFMDEGRHNRLCYVIYDSNTGIATEPREVMKQIQEDTALRTGTLAEEIEKTDYAVNLADCGEDVLLTWNKYSTEDEAEGNLELLKSLSVASVYYNKESGKFHDYNILTPEENTIYVKPTVTYNENSGLAQVFYQTLDISEVTLDTTLAELQELPTELRTASANPKQGEYRWGESHTIGFNEHTLSYYDSVEYKDGVLLSYVASDTTGFTLEGADGVDESQGFNTVNAMYLQHFTLDENGNLVSTDPVQITDTDYVVANPEFARIKTDLVDNTLLFYKSNGRYAYQNIDTLLTNAVYTDTDGNEKISKDYMDPVYISDEPDYTVNDDFSVFYNEDGTIYALFTVTEGAQQQIWAKHFYVDGVDVVSETPVRDSEGNALYDADGNIITEPLADPITLIRGTWGTKTYLTEGGIGANGDEGFFKSNFTADVLDNGNIVVVFNSQDFEYTEEGTNIINNSFVVAEYDPSDKYELPEAGDAVEFSDNYPTVGETVSVKMRAKNVGVKTGRDLAFNLYVDGELYSRVPVELWFADETKAVSADYTLPDGKNPAEVDIYYTVTDNSGAVVLTSQSYSFRNDADLVMTGAQVSPLKLIKEDGDTAKFMLSVKVKNNGNMPYDGGDVVKFVNSDLMAQTAAIDPDSSASTPLYESFGNTLIPALGVGEETTLYFISEEVPHEVFKNSAGGNSANLEFVIEEAEDADWKTIGENDEYSFIGVYNPGLTQTPAPRRVKSLESSDITVAQGEIAMVMTAVTPALATPFANLTYETSDASIATVNEHGLVTGVAAGTAVITVKAGDAMTTLNVTVGEHSGLRGDSDGNGTVNIKDATLIQKYVADLAKLNVMQYKCADANADGSTNIKDATEIQKYIADIKTKAPIGETVTV